MNNYEFQPSSFSFNFILASFLLETGEDIPVYHTSISNIKFPEMIFQGGDRDRLLGQNPHLNFPGLVWGQRDIRKTAGLCNSARDTFVLGFFSCSQKKKKLDRWPKTYLFLPPPPNSSFDFNIMSEELFWKT